MSAFIQIPGLRFTSDEKAELLGEEIYESDTLGATVIVPVGFVTDGWSVPRAAWCFMPHWGEHAEDAIVHDYLYQTQKVPRDVADAVLLEAMEVSGLGWCKRHTIYRLIRMFGQYAWDKDKQTLASRTLKPT